MRWIPLLALVAACAAPEPADPGPAGPEAPGATADRTDGAPPADTASTPDSAPLSTPFDAAVWMASVEAAETDAERIALSGRLLDAVDWRTACGEDDPTAPGRGLVRLLHLDARNALAEVTCQRGAYQSTFALVDARAGRPPRLVRALGVDEYGRVVPDTTASFFGVLSHDPATAPSRFDVLTKSAGHGGCGTDARYRLLPDGGAAVERVLAHPDCDAPLPPAEWPESYPLE